jgi:hypothetical protein
MNQIYMEMTDQNMIILSNRSGKDRVFSASVRWPKKLFKTSSLRQGAWISGVHLAIRDRIKISWV